jgi:hypothetical protein
VGLSLGTDLSLLGSNSINTFLRQSRIVGGAVFYAVRVVSDESLWVCLCILLSLLDTSSVYTVLRQRKILGGVSYSVRVVSKDSRRLVLSRISC